MVRLPDRALVTCLAHEDVTSLLADLRQICNLVVLVRVRGSGWEPEL